MKFKILNILSNILDTPYDKLISNLDESTLLNEIGFDSLKLINFIVLAEDEFRIEFLDSDLIPENFKNINAIEATITKYIQPNIKVIICDCDNVLWNGVSGEEEISIEDHHLKLQHKLIQFYNNGFLLCLCSKNKTSNIERAFKELDIQLKLDYIITKRINRIDKPTNLLSISNELNLSLDSFIFLDDSAYEIGLVNALMPNVTTITVNYKEKTFLNVLDSYLVLPNIVTDHNRLYKQQKERTRCKKLYNSTKEYNKSLLTELNFQTNSLQNVERISELSQRTNQFNLSNKRYSSAEILELMYDPDYTIITMSAKDLYGDMGIIGCAIIKNSSVSIITDFYISCRVFDRNFEYELITKIKKLIPRQQLYGIYNPTKQNEHYSKFYLQNNILLYPNKTPT
jgi:FkbH-like protein